MNRTLLLISFLALLVMSACHTAKQSAPPPVIVTNSDSIRIEYIETVRIDSVTVEIPVPVESSRQVVKDSTSHLETSLAFSDAWINADGSLGHSIKNKDENFHAVVPVPVKDTQTNNNSTKVREIPVPYPVEKKVIVEKDLSAWQKFRLGSFWFLIIALAASLIYIFRKPLLRLACRLKL